jgi:DNA-binding response OmpR family regulator
MIAAPIDWESAGATQAEPAANDDTRANAASQATVLVVEDEVLIRAVVCDHLRGCGYRVLEAANGEEAQKVFEQNRAKDGDLIDIMFSDVQLGSGMNGFTLASWVRQTHPGVRIVLASGVARLSQEAEHLCDGRFFTKPFSHSRLAAEINALLAKAGRKRDERALAPHPVGRGFGGRRDEPRHRLLL